MPRSTMEVSHYGQWYIGHRARYVHQLYIALLVDSCLPRYGVTHIWLHGASYSYSLLFHVPFLNVHPGSYFSRLHWQPGGGLTGVCIVGCVTVAGELAEALVVRLNWDPLPPGWGVFGAITSCCGKGEEDDNKKKSGVLSTIWLASSQNRMSDCQLAHCTQDKAYCVQLQAAQDFKGPAICRKSVRCSLFVFRDIIRWTTAEISSFMNLDRTFFDRKDVWWCQSQAIPGILDETHNNHQVMLYG